MLTFTARSSARLPPDNRRVCLSCCTHLGEIHNLHDPDGEGQVNDHGDQEQQQEEIEASFSPAVQAHRVHGVAARSLEVQGLGRENKLLLGNLGNKQTN